METAIFSITDNNIHSQYLSTTSKGIDIFLRMKRIESSLATLYFTDEDNNILEIPKNIVIYTYNNYTAERVVLKPLPNVPRYVLCHTDDYEIEYYSQIILSLKPQRVWKINYKK